MVVISEDNYLLKYPSEFLVLKSHRMPKGAEQKQHDFALLFIDLGEKFK